MRGPKIITYRTMEDQKKDALEFANQIRKDLGFRPVKTLRKGIPRSPTCCPISRTIEGRLSSDKILGVATGSGHVNVIKWDATIQYDVPPEVMSFIETYDLYAFPELILSVQAEEKLYERKDSKV